MEASRGYGRMDVAEEFFKSNSAFTFLPVCQPLPPYVTWVLTAALSGLSVLLMVLFPALPLGAAFSVSDKDSLHTWLSSIRHSCPVQKIWLWL